MGMRRRWWFVALGAVVLTVSGVAVAYANRTGPQFPLVHGSPYPIEIGEDGCPVVPEHVPFVDSPGQFVAPDPSEVILCTRVDDDGDGVPEPPSRPGAGGLEIPPLQRTLRGSAAAEFATLLNQLPDRNGAWRDWQRRHSGFWPDAPWANGPWDADGECFSALMLPVRSFTYVLHYSDRDAVPIIGTCHGWTDGTRTRIPVTYTPPHLTDEFVALYESQP
jgi:hypothetical protein